MGRARMGEAPRGNMSGGALRDPSGKFISDTRPPHIVREYMAGGIKPSARRKHTPPSVGDRFGELTVTGYKVGCRGGIVAIMAKCSCGSEEHPVHTSNLRRGKSTRCGACAKKQAGFWKKRYTGYAAIVPDDDHRARLLDRISACIMRCHPTKGHKNYGLRGITVHHEWIVNRGAFLKYVVSLNGWNKPECDLDRIDNNRGYEPGNLRFISRSDNNRNRRTVSALQQENDDLRHRLRRAEEQIYHCDRCRAAYRP